MITVYTDKVYLKFYNLFKEFNLFELAKAHYNASDDEQYETEVALLTAWIGINKKYGRQLVLPEDRHIYYNLSKENLSLYHWMQTCMDSIPFSYCHTCSNFQVHFMKYNKVFMVSTPDGMAQVTIQNVLDKSVYDEYLDYKMFTENRKIALDTGLLWYDNGMHRAIDGLLHNRYNIYEILTCIRYVNRVWEDYFKDTTESQVIDTTENGQDEDDE